VEIMKHKI